MLKVMRAHPVRRDLLPSHSSERKNRLETGMASLIVGGTRQSAATSRRPSPLPPRPSATPPARHIHISIHISAHNVPAQHTSLFGTSPQAQQVRSVCSSTRIRVLSLNLRTLHTILMTSPQAKLSLGAAHQKPDRIGIAIPHAHGAVAVMLRCDGRFG